MPTGTIPMTHIVEIQKLESILLSSGWVNVKNCELVPYTVGSSPQSNYETGLKFTDATTNKEHMVKLSAIQAYRGEFSS